MKQVLTLLQKEIILEWKQRFAFSGLLLYLISTLLIVYISFINVEPFTWIALFWIINLFTAVSAVAKSFMQESRWRMLYYYSTVSANELIIARMIYNTTLMFVISLIGLAIYSVITANPILHEGYFVVAVLLGCMSFSFTFTLMSAIAGKAGNNFTLMSILSFPIIIPVLLLLLKISLATLATQMDFPAQDLALLGGMNLITLLMALILFPYLWRE